ncbi:hypothetical protein ScPMuIL_005141 [Solemya velum]
MSKNMMIRVQSPQHGTKRVEARSSDSAADLLNKIQSLFNLKDSGWDVYKTRDKKDWIRTSRAKNLDFYKIRHGDMLYLFESDIRPSHMADGDSTTIPLTGYGTAVIEDEVDQYLEKQDGKIYRKRNEQLCRHGPKNKCLHCVPLEPYDEEFLKSCDPPIKFLSFHSHIRKITGGVDKGKFASLENLSCKIKSGCTEHPPWPGGICTKCQPCAVTLNRQSYRHVDNIMFENPTVADRFLNYWRSTGNQRIGILFGRYESHKDVPLGIKATVAAIYEPPQRSTSNRIELLEDPLQSQVNHVAQQLGVFPVGWIFTDLVAEDLSKGTVKNLRGNISSHFLSAEECIMAADFQNKYPNPCKLSPVGHFGSKFVTVVVTGDSNNQIHFDGYQVSDQCMALCRDDCLIPTKDVAELGYIKESSNEQYVPDVFYKDKDEYGNEVTQLARPLPVEYLLIDLPAAFPVEPQHTFQSCEGMKPFPIENREELGESQDFNALTLYMEQCPPEKFLEAMSDFHLLTFLGTSDMLPLKEKLGLLLDAVKNKDEAKSHHFKKTEEWATVEEMMAAHAPSPTASRQSSYVGPGAAPLPPIGSAGALWTCAHCTFLNTPEKQNCDVCSLPR